MDGVQMGWGKGHLTILIITARSRSAVGKTRKAALPPSSRLRRFTVEDDCLYNNFPTWQKQKYSKEHLPNNFKLTKSTCSLGLTLFVYNCCLRCVDLCWSSERNAGHQRRFTEELSNSCCVAPKNMLFMATHDCADGDKKLKTSVERGTCLM